jgi:hypothetical protein
MGTKLTIGEGAEGKYFARSSQTEFGNLKFRCYTENSSVFLNIYTYLKVHNHPKHK